MTTAHAFAAGVIATCAAGMLGSYLRGFLSAWRAERKARATRRP